jgi:hypothetical protein
VNLSILEIMGCSVVSLKYWDTLFGGEELLRGVFNYYSDGTTTYILKIHFNICLIMEVKCSIPPEVSSITF